MTKLRGKGRAGQGECCGRRKYSTAAHDIGKKEGISVSTGVGEFGRMGGTTSARKKKEELRRKGLSP